MAGAAASVLGQSDLDQINTALRLAHDHLDVVAKGAASGMDVRAENDLLNHYVQRLQALKQQFFPGR